jgi:hypothetical protein
MPNSSRQLAFVFREVFRFDKLLSELIELAP